MELVVHGTQILSAETALDAIVPEVSDMKGQWGLGQKTTFFEANEQLDKFGSKAIPVPFR